MRVAVFQMDPVYGMPQWNIDKASLWISGLPSNTDIAVLPEMFDTAGAECTAESTAEKMKCVAVEYNIAVCFTTIEDGKNRFYFIHPDGHADTYDKRHLFPLSHEVQRVTAGDSLHVIQYRGIKILPQICYDLRFPVWSRNTPENPYDIAIYPASWPGKRILAWETLLSARAIENQCYVIGAGRIGFGYPGNSRIVDFTGEVISAADSDLECSISAELDIEKLGEFRRNFCIFGDFDNFSIK